MLQWVVPPLATFTGADMYTPPRIPFRIPNLAGTVYAPGPQPYNPGESVQPWGGFMGLKNAITPWPLMVPVINALANNGGTPRSRAPIPVVNQYSPLPSELLYIKGFIGKSKG